MKITILTFGIARDIVGADSVELSVPDQCRVSDIQEIILKDYPGFKRLASLLVAVNATYADPDRVVAEHDEIALIPPVSGG